MERLEAAADLLTYPPEECNYPTVCGNYGICSNGQCSCLRENDANVSYFLPLNARQPNLGCYETTPLSCLVTQTHVLLHLQDIYYFNYIDINSSTLKGIDVESCKQACLKNCSCKAALFGCNGVVSDGSCFLHSQLFSLMNNPTEKIFSNSSVFIKVQIPSSSASPSAETRNEVTLPPSSKKISQTTKVVGSVLVVLFGAFLIISFCYVLVRKRKVAKQEDEDCFDQVPGMLARFSYEELRVATKNFCKKLDKEDLDLFLCELWVMACELQ